jgi:hypothetical protein
MSNDDSTSKDAFFRQLAHLSDAMIDAHGKDFTMGALVLAARFIAEREARATPGAQADRGEPDSARQHAEHGG